MKLKEGSCCWVETGIPREEGAVPVAAGPGTPPWLDDSEGFYRDTRGNRWKGGCERAGMRDVWGRGRSDRREGNARVWPLRPLLVYNWPLATIATYIGQRSMQWHQPRPRHEGRLYLALCQGSSLAYTHVIVFTIGDVQYPPYSTSQHALINDSYRPSARSAGYCPYSHTTDCYRCCLVQSNCFPFTILLHRIFTKCNPLEAHVKLEANTRQESYNNVIGAVALLCVHNLIAQ